MKQQAFTELLELERLYTKINEYPNELFKSNCLSPEDIKSFHLESITDIRKDLLKTDNESEVKALEIEISETLKAAKQELKNLKNNKPIIVGIFI